MKLRQAYVLSSVRLLFFLVVLLPLSPVFLLGAVAYIIRLKLYNQPKGISGTAYEPFLTRVMAHVVGGREDEIAYRLAPMLPALTPLTLQLLVWPLVLASRLARYKPVLFCGPVTRPATVMMMMALRNQFYDQVLREVAANVDQVVILGAGWDTRAYEELNNGDVHIFEVDTPATQLAKIAALQKAGIESSHVTFVETDFNQVSWVDALQKHGFEPALRTLVLWEGVTMYLPEDAVRSTLAAVAELGPGSLIAFDYFAREFVEGEGGFKFVAPYMKLSIDLTYGERFIFGIPLRSDGSAAVAALLESCGLTLERFEMVGRQGSMTAFYGFAVGERM